jgi:putative Flp pilus-assembly TadE/G-like protein
MRGQTGVIMTLAMATIVGAIGLCTDVGLFYFNWMRLQKAADSAAIAGAIHLTGIPSSTDNSQVIGAANQYAQLNGVKSGEIVSTTVASDAKSVTIQLQRTVPYVFARVLGLSQGAVAARATAGLNNTLSPRGMLPIGLPCTVSNSSQANCNGQYKKYSDGGGLYNLSTKFPLGATGSWGKLALGGSGISIFDSNIIYGYNGAPLNVGDLVSPETGNAGQPTIAAFDTRMSNAGESWSGANTVPPATLSSTDPQAVLVPMVDFTGGNGNSQQFPITGFAEMYIVSVSKSGGDIQINAYFIQPLANNGIASNTTCSVSSAPNSSCTAVLLQ